MNLSQNSQHGHNLLKFGFTHTSDRLKYTLTNPPHHHFYVWRQSGWTLSYVRNPAQPRTDTDCFFELCVLIFLMLRSGKQTGLDSTMVSGVRFLREDLQSSVFTVELKSLQRLTQNLPIWTVSLSALEALRDRSLLIFLISDVLNILLEPLRAVSLAWVPAMWGWKAMKPRIQEPEWGPNTDSQLSNPFLSSLLILT